MKHKPCCRAAAMLLAVLMILSLFSGTALAAQEDPYHDPAKHWLDAANRTNELDANAVVTHETFFCAECNGYTSFLVWRTPEYTRDGQTAKLRNIQYSDGTLLGGVGTGAILDGTPGVDSTYTGYHWTKASCEICGTMNSNISINDYSHGKNVYWLYDCDLTFMEDLEETVAYTPADDTYHLKTVDGGSYCSFCYGTRHAHSSVLELHEPETEILPQPGHQRFAVITRCTKCGYIRHEYIGASAVVSDYIGTVDGQPHSLTVSDLSERGVSTQIRYGLTAECCDQSAAPAFTEAGRYAVYYEITYTYEGVSMSENGVSYVWLRDETQNTRADGCEDGNHRFAMIASEVPTCLAGGYDRYVCLDCGEAEKRNETAALGHLWQSIVIREADCTHDGRILRICSRCGLAEIESIPGREHSFTSHAVEPTCTAPGYTVSECAVCGERRITDITPALSHHYEIAEIPGTCTESGMNVCICSRCGDSFPAGTTPAKGHVWDGGKVIASATCTGESVIQHTCTVCSAGHLEAGSAKGHIPGAAATCTEPQICEECGAVLEKAAGHDFTMTVTEPTCMKMGFTTYVCKHCGLTYKSDYIEALGHAYDAAVTEPTCLKDGYTTYTCERCGDSYTADAVHALGHELNEGRIITAATCTGEGVIEYDCIRCPYHEIHAIPAKGHTPGAAATCTEPQICEECGVILNPATGHDYEAVVTEPACTELGYTTCTCRYCGQSTKTDYVLPTGHKYTANVTEPACEKAGYTTYTCEYCGDSYVTDRTEPLGHEFGEGIPVTDPGCTCEGVMAYVCIRCPYHEFHAVSAAGHVPGAAATCTAPQLCEHCGAVLVNAPGHDYKAVVTEPTCTKMGYTTYTCTRCGENYKSDYTDALGHRESGWIMDAEPTTSAEGRRHKECERCGEVLASETLEKLYNTATTNTHGEAIVGGYLVIVTDTDTHAPVSNAAVTLNADPAISVRLPDGRILDYADQTTVTVLLVKDGAPVQDMTVSVTDRNDNFCAEKTDGRGRITVPGTSGMTNADGKATVGFTDADGNSFTITVKVSDFETGRPIRNAFVRVGTTGNITARLPDGVDMDRNDRIVVTVTDSRRNPKSGVTVIVKGNLGQTETGKTDEDGVLTVPEIAASENHCVYIYGYPDGTFGPERSMTRSEATAIFARLLAARSGATILPVEYTRFADVGGKSWYSGYVRYLSSCGVVFGCSDGLFRPDEAITRSEFVVMAVRFFEVYGDGNAEIMEEYARFNDVSSGYWAAAYIADAAMRGWIKGYGDGSFRGDSEITRAEVVTIVNRLLGRSADADFITENLRSMNTFTDLSRRHWAYYDVMEAANPHTAFFKDGEIWSR